MQEKRKLRFKSRQVTIRAKQANKKGGGDREYRGYMPD